MSSRVASQPPLLDGYRFESVLGSGGFADVFCYQQRKPNRKVAVKVLLRGLGEQAQRHFEDEADLMAMLSNHPSIVSIYAAGQAPDGRPYLVMELCQPGHLGARIKKRPFSVRKALEIGIHVAGAVESAHRLGILHRDIKPANILFTEFGRAALTDFGISVAGDGPASTAFSVAWAPPEQIDGAAMDVTGDVYSLAATIWAMLKGRSPFDKPGDNNSLAVTTRVRTMPPPPIGRPDVPELLEGVLRTAMAKRPEQRYGSALEFARALQGVQAELHHSVTTIDVREDHVDDLVDHTETGTRITGFLPIDPDVSGTDAGTASGAFEISDEAGTRATGFLTDFPSTPGQTTGAVHTIPRDRVDRLSLSEVTPGRSRTGGTSGTTGTGTTGTGGASYTTDRQVMARGYGSMYSSGPLDFTGPSVPQLPDDPTGGAVVASTEPGKSAAQPRRGRTPMIVTMVLLAIVAGVIGVWFGNGQQTTTQPTSPSPTALRPHDPIPSQVKPIIEGKGVRQGTSVVFTWKNPDALDGDTFLYRPIYPEREVGFESLTKPTVTVPAQTGNTCIEVQIRRSTGQSSDPVRICLNK